jgi:hypothetical protein
MHAVDETMKEEEDFGGDVYAVLPPPDAYQVPNTRDSVQKDTILTNSSFFFSFNKVVCGWCALYRTLIHHHKDHQRGIFNPLAT